MAANASSLLESYNAPVAQVDRASAFEVGSAYHISAASGVAYIETRGATNPLNWTEVGLKLPSDHWGYAVMPTSSDCLVTVNLQPFG